MRRRSDIKARIDKIKGKVTTGNSPNKFSNSKKNIKQK
jgi:hypothetical protein